MSIYLDRYATKSLELAPMPNPNTELIVVIPVYNEPDLLISLESLYRCELPPTHTEIIIVINEPEECHATISKQNQTTFLHTENWIKTHQKEKLRFYLSHVKLPAKHAGVGLARKTGMDEAVRRFESIGMEKGIILCYDADCTCKPNLLKEVFLTFKNKNLFGASIYFEHLINNLSKKETEGILQYELHLRYYINALRKADYPFAFHTVGSSMAVRTDIYKKAGGMNQRKAGEDFHFLHKIIPYSNYEEINSTAVFPSSRTSTRVPFGTGKAMESWMNNSSAKLVSYHPRIFKILNVLLKQVPVHFRNDQVSKEINKLPDIIQMYLAKEKYLNVLVTINKQSNTMTTFIHRWFLWFNGLKALHFVHFVRDHLHASIPVVEAASNLAEVDSTNTYELLTYYQELDRKFTADQISLKHLYSEFL